MVSASYNFYSPFFGIELRTTVCVVITTCDESSDCENAGICQWEGEDKFCDCKNGTRGGKCEHIDDCEEGIFKECHGDRGTCYYDAKYQKAKCVCSKGKSLDQNVNFCKVIRRLEKGRIEHISENEVNPNKIN
ncbi:uncharacterized protein CEXT_341711 [Caerostris extrusa]|uniref:EGF-like domain-containing protein n=1 Tax=Caerostris extrusa TaxID=172846 RepID=A0AAV4QR16_CAEEX|nr:uncharacterized protein CEXT_341711 [Caerostris extrusa]